MSHRSIHGDSGKSNVTTRPFGKFVAEVEGNLRDRVDEAEEPLTCSNVGDALEGDDFKDAVECRSTG
jgi:hypothetical protein